MPDWKAIRREFPALENRTYLNTATYGQLARQTSAAILGHLERRDRFACADFLEWFDDMDRIREDVARLIHGDADGIAFVTNAATALSLLLGGLEWKAGDRIVTFQDEFPNNVYYPSLLGLQGIEFVECSTDDYESAVIPGTRLVIASTLNYRTGFRAPLEKISECCRRAGALLYVDATQGLGGLQVDVTRFHPDMLVSHGYKWLLAPNGAAFFYVSKSMRDRLRPNVIGWRSDRRWRDVDSLHHGAPEWKDAAEKYEGGMLNFPSLYGLGASVRMLLDIGPEAIEQRVLDLAEQARKILESAGGEVKFGNSPILAARFPGRDPSQLAAALKTKQILVSARHGNLRVSTHFYNGEEDLQRLETVLRNG